MKKLLPAFLSIALALTANAAKEGGKKNKEKERIEVCFVLDTTGSMGGLIQGAKEKIWSIANEILSSKPTPELGIGLIGYRDIGDDYVTKVYDLSEDIDDIYAKLMKFQAGGGGDGPESVNQAIHEAVTKMKWDKKRDVLKLVFLVGDAPPHMDYQDDVKYQQVCQQAVKKDIIINTVQCGNNSRATPIWKEIAKLAEGDYVAIAQSGGVASISTPVDKEIALLNRELGGTVVAYGDASARRIVTEKSALADEATAEVAADRLSVLSLKSKAYSSFSGAAVAPGSIAVVDGDGDLIQSLASGKIGYDKIEDKKLSSKLKKMSAKDREKYLKEQVAKRQELQKRLEELLVKRRDYVSAEKEKLKKEGKADGFDAKVSEIISKRRK
ncbi:MAG: VWA domain-containing protein [Opitutae bacterium]|nr:VWA domain-containing protein [Opitutae bacterium]